jgi:hypothetical protein
MLYSAKVLIAIPMILVGGTEIQTLNLLRVLMSDRYQFATIEQYRKCKGYGSSRA